ncbi:MAG: uracil-DNA glycosylase [Bacteroidia bacterium]|nr:MAG: uracil-DNA glycosylase [Bacteroidia bacterium]
MDVRIEESWKELLEAEFGKSYFGELVEFVRQEYRTGTIYPPAQQIFNAFEKCPFNRVKTVILGQDPYHGPGQAHGLCFSVNDGVGHPPSLVNIFKEIGNNFGLPYPASGNLERWAQQGVLLLNATLTVRAHSPGSHQNKGWEIFTDEVIRLISGMKQNVVFFLWGSYAQKKGAQINRGNHLVLESVHPSPLSAYRGFYGNNHFRECNEYLIFSGQQPVDWR